MASGRPYKVESCVISLIQALSAEQSGADRIEICTRLETEGMTPDIDVVSSLCANLRIPVRVMIRSTAQGYDADGKVMKDMIQSIQELKSFPIQGFVFGVIKNNLVDREAMTVLIQHAYPFPITFHKAIDFSDDIRNDLEWLNSFTQIDTVLTSGGADRAIAGVDQILRMKSIFQGNIMAAGKIIPADLPVLHQQLGLEWYHGRAII